MQKAWISQAILKITELKPYTIWPHTYFEAEVIETVLLA